VFLLCVADNAKWLMVEVLFWLKAVEVDLSLTNKKRDIGQLKGRKGLTLLCYGLLVWWVSLVMERRMRARKRILAFLERERELMLAEKKNDN